MDDVKTINVPMYDSLTVAEILKFADDFNKVDRYMPEDVDLPKMPRQWIINVCAADIGTPFKNWVLDKIEEHSMNV